MKLLQARPADLERALRDGGDPPQHDDPWGPPSLVVALEELEHGASEVQRLADEGATFSPPDIVARAERAPRSTADVLAPIARASARLSADGLIAYRAEVEALLAEPDLPEVDRQLLAARLREAEAERSPEPTDLRLPAA